MNSICNNTCIELGKGVCPNQSISTSIPSYFSVTHLGTSILVLIFSLLIFISSATAQTDFYNENFVKLTDLNEIKDFVAEMKENCDADRYRINKTPVVEYYDKNDKSFKGLCIDTEMVSFDKINIIKKDKSLKKFIKAHGLQLGSALYFKKPYVGMNQGHVKLIVGEPDKIKYAIDGESQVIHFKYADGRVFTFKDDLLQGTIDSKSKTPIALKQP